MLGAVLAASGVASAAPTVNVPRQLPARCPTAAYMSKLSGTRMRLDYASDSDGVLECTYGGRFSPVGISLGVISVPPGKSSASVYAQMRGLARSKHTSMHRISHAGRAAAYVSVGRPHPGSSPAIYAEVLEGHRLLTMNDDQPGWVVSTIARALA